MLENAYETMAEVSFMSLDAWILTLLGLSSRAILAHIH